MSADALAQAFTRLISSKEFVSQVREDEDAALGTFDLTDAEANLLADAAHEGVELMGDGEGKAMKRIGAELQGVHGQITIDPQLLK